MVRRQRRDLRCPLCHNEVTASKLIFYEGHRCVRSDSILRVPRVYVRILVLFSFVIAFLLVWAVGVRSTVLFSLFWLPTGFLVGTVVVPAALFLLPPILVADEPGHVTTLGLGHGRGDRGGEH
jgi:prepilin signal peptidase PulO-like enzyme (type II secretory pathway)